MNFGDKQYNISVVDQRSTDAFSDTGGVITGVYAFVYDAGTKTLSTLYADDKRTSLANPITRTQFATDDAIKFWSASTSHDIYINSSNGDEALYAGVTPDVHLLQLNTASVDKHLVVPFSALTPETDSGVDLPMNCWVKDAIVEVVTLDAGETVNVGLLSTESGGNASGILAAVALDAAGFIKPFTITDGTTEDYVSAVSWGALMGLGSTGTNTANDFGQAGNHGHTINTTTARSVVYNCSAGSDTAAGYLHLWFKHFR